MNPKDPARTGRAVFQKFRRGAWIVSVVVHGTIFAVLAFLVLRVRTGQTRVVEVSEMEFAPPPRPPPHTPPPPPPPPPPPSPDPEPAVRTHTVVAPEHQTSAPRSARSVEAPHVMTAAAAPNANSTNSMATGNSNDFHGGNVGGEAGGGEPGGHPAPPTPPIAPHDHAPAPAPQAEVADELLSVHPSIRCDGGRVAALYPEAAQDAEVEGDIAVEVVVDATGQIRRGRARNDPGFGLAAAAERALMTACQGTAIPRDAQGRAVATRVVHTIHFHLD